MEFNYRIFGLLTPNHGLNYYSNCFVDGLSEAFAIGYYGDNC